MDTDNIVLDEETILNNIKDMYNGNWNDIMDYYKKVTKFTYIYYDSVCHKAASIGHLEILKYAHENGCRLDDHWTSFHAATDGQLEVLKYARENGCRWDKNICSGAAREGHLEVLYYLYENEAPYGTYWGIHPNCKEFFDTFGEHWKKGDFSLMHGLKPAKKT